MKKRTNNKGITLIALVITIIVLLILAGVSIAMLTGENGILSQAQKAKEETENATQNEESVLENYEQYIEGSTNGGTLTTVTGNETENTKVQDSLGNTVWVPAGFRVVNPGDNVEDGIIIEDVSHGATAGSQFVWIPVGTIQTSKGEVTINLDRYTFEENGNVTGKGEEIINNNYQELSEGNQNTPAKDINNFKETVKEIYKGYYIGRYEARDGIVKNARTSDTSDENTLVCTSDNYIYNFITQSQAANLSRNMYSNDNFESDLVNSYAWDTAIVFIQEFDDRETKTKVYSWQWSLNGEFAPFGTNKLEKKDVVCNIYDMASNCYEWTTENSSSSSGPCVSRGGSYYQGGLGIASGRGGNLASGGGATNSFRPILYLK